MPKIIIIPFSQIEKTCQDAVTYANSCQSDFSFYLIPPIDLKDSPLINPYSEFLDILNYLDSLKRRFNYDSRDLILTFYNGILSAKDYGLTNLFMAGTNIDENPPCNGVISLKYLDWGILEEKYNYEVQKHSILHLIVCGIIGTYTHVQAHSESYGCLLDRNDRLVTFNQKLQKGYYLCSHNEKNCYENIGLEKYGKSIIRLCENFKNSNYKTIVQEIIMGDKFENISNSTIINRSNLENALNRNKNDKDFAEILDKVRQLVEQSGNKDVGEAFNDFTEELSKEEPKKSKLKSFWDSLTSYLPNILSMTDITGKIIDMIK